MGEKGQIADLSTKLSYAGIARFFTQLGYYADGLATDLVPQEWQKRRLRRLFDGLNADALDPVVRQRVNYYNKLTGPVSLQGDIALADLPRERSRYFYDIMTPAKPFGQDRRLAYLYGDVKKVQDTPTIAKSRPIAGGNANSVLLNLNKLRHFRRADDKIAFADKSPTVVWRGRLCNKMRFALAEKYERHPNYDIGYSVKGSRRGFDKRGVAPKPFLSISDQCQHRYILSLEGNDVATSLKWVMSSNSLCLSPRLVYETWFMEGTLEPGKHYAEVRRDFADLEDKIAHFEANPDEAEMIIRNAQAYRAQFQEKSRERLISYLVLQKYFERSGQCEAEAFSEALFT